MQAQDVWHFDLNTSGSVIQRYFYDPHIVQLYLLTNVKQILTRFVSSLSLITVLWVTSWKLALVATVMLCVTLLPSTKIRNVIRKATTHANDLTGDLLSMYTETIGGIRLIQSYNLAESRKSLFVRQQRYLFSQVMRLIKAQGWLTPSMHIISSLAVAVIIWMGSYLVISKELSTGAFVSFLAALILLYNPIKNLGSSILSTQIALLAASRVFDILDSPPTRLELMEGIQLLAPVGDIRFENVCFSYLNDHPVLEDINLHIRENETVAFVGESGGGKTTLVNLLLRFYDVWDGAISIGGRDIRSINMASLRQHISLVTQDSFLFNTTIRKNILVGKANADETELWQVLEKVGLDKFIKKLPNGLETIVGDRGTALSGGQRQRITIARALLKDAPIVVLDEATSALDNESEHFIQQAIQDLMKSKTVIIIAHRLSTIQQADRVVVIGGGRILEQGSPQNLCNSKGVYHRLYQLHLAAAL
jgi:subfamily B ATP-binding cassette protein MsbA